MSERENQKLVEDQFAALNAHDVEGYVKQQSETHVWESDAFPSPVRGREAAKQVMRMYFKAFPDLHFETEQVIAKGDTVIVCWRATGTHKGEYNGIAPTHRKVSLRGCTVGEIKDGRAVKATGYWDQLTLLQQLGVSAAKGAGAR